MPIDVARLPEDGRAEDFLALIDYWQSKCADGRLPGRQHIDPLELPRHALAQVLLFDVCRESGRLRFRFRIAGTGFGALTGAELTGRYLDEMAPPERTRPVTDAMALIVKTRRPVYLAGPPTLLSRDYYRVRRIGLPLAHDGHEVDMIIAAFLPERRTNLGDDSEAPYEEPILL